MVAACVNYGMERGPVCKKQVQRGTSYLMGGPRRALLHFSDLLPSLIVHPSRPGWVLAGFQGSAGREGGGSVPEAEEEILKFVF